MGEQRTALILLLILCVAISTLPLVGASENSWTTLEPMPTPRASFGVAVVEGKIYAIGGGTDTIVGTNEMYDPATDMWTTKQPMPTPRHSFGIAVYQNKIYVIGGTIGPGIAVGESLLTGATEVYDPITDTWEIKTSMPTPRQGLEANVVSDKIYLIGGVRYVGGFLHQEFDENEVYDPATDSWTIKAPLPTAVWGYSSAVVDNEIYLIGGGNKTTGGIFPVTLNQIYTPATDTWDFGQTIPTGLWHADSGVTTGVFAPERIYVLGGSYYSVAYNLTQTYDPEVDGWTTGTPMPTPRWSLSVAVVDDELYAIGGKTEEDTYSVVNEKYTPHGYIPEFPFWTPILIMLVAVMALSVIYKRKLQSAGRRWK
jgi:hypothetical protein